MSVRDVLDRRDQIRVVFEDSYWHIKINAFGPQMSVSDKDCYLAITQGANSVIFQIIETELETIFYCVFASLIFWESLSTFYRKVELFSRFNAACCKLYGNRVTRCINTKDGILVNIYLKLLPQSVPEATQIAGEHA